MKPSEFWASSTEDKVYMTAYTQVHFAIKSVEDREMEKKIDKANKAPKRK